MIEQNSLKYIAPKIREALEDGKLAEFETHGHSMIPLLHDGGDKVRLVKPEGALSVGDVAFCLTDDGRYVLHRVIALENGGYRLRGDNCVGTEFCRGDEDVVGLACAFIRRGRLIEADSFVYRFYCHFRKPILKIWQTFWKVADKIVSIK